MNLKKLLILPSKNYLMINSELQRKKLIEKIAMNLKFQYNKNFQEINYNIKSLISDLKDNVTYNDMINQTFDYIFFKIEKLI